VARPGNAAGGSGDAHSHNVRQYCLCLRLSHKSASAAVCCDFSNGQCEGVADVDSAHRRGGRRHVCDLVVDLSNALDLCDSLASKQQRGYPCSGAPPRAADSFLRYVEEAMPDARAVVTSKS